MYIHVHLYRLEETHSDLPEVVHSVAKGTLGCYVTRVTRIDVHLHTTWHFQLDHTQLLVYTYNIAGIDVVRLRYIIIWVKLHSVLVI